MKPITQVTIRLDEANINSSDNQLDEANHASDNRLDEANHASDNPA